MSTVLVLVVIMVGLYLRLRRGFDYWKQQGIPYEEPTIIVGNLAENYLMKKSARVIINDIYRKFKDYPFVGIFRGHKPCLLIRDMDFFKNIVVKDFKSFSDNEFIMDKNVEPLLGRNPFFMKGNEWKIKRAELSSAFTPARMKAMFPLAADVCEQMIEYIHNLPKNSNGIELEAKELVTKFTIDTSTSCIFGLQANCFEHTKSQFRTLAEKFYVPGGWTGFLLLLNTNFPFLKQFINFKVTGDDEVKQLLQIVESVLKYRKEYNIVRPDFLDIFSKLENNNQLDIVAHCTVVFTEGFETTSHIITFLLYELACNEDTQEKLRQEINYVNKKYNGQFTYDGLQEMAYLHACVYESMRKNHITGAFFKVCTKPYSYTSTNPQLKKMTVHLKPGDLIVLPAEIHNDAKYYPEPEKFKPERFINNSNKSLCFVFGEGPRICLGRLFSLLEIKICVAYLIKNFKITVNQKTKTPFQFLPYYVFLSPRGGIWLNFNKIS